MTRRPLLLLLLLLAACGVEGDVDVASTVPHSTVAPGSAASSLMLRPGQTAPGATAAVDDHGDGSHAATPLALGESVSGQLSTVDDRDWFAVDLDPAPHAFSLSCFGNARLVLYAPDGTTELARSTPGSTELTHTTTQPGRHFLRVETDSGRDLFYGLEVD